MKFKEVIKNNAGNWSKIKETLIKLYPEQKKSVDGYRKVFWNLLDKKPVECDSQLTVKITKNPDEKSYIRVLGFNKKAKHKYMADESIEFMPWNKWLGMKIRKETLQQFSEIEIICHSMWEMTYCGFQEEKIQKEIKRIFGRIKKFK